MLRCANAVVALPTARKPQTQFDSLLCAAPRSAVAVQTRLGGASSSAAARFSTLECFANPDTRLLNESVWKLSLWEAG